MCVVNLCFGVGKSRFVSSTALSYFFLPLLPNQFLLVPIQRALTPIRQLRSHVEFHIVLFFVSAVLQCLLCTVPDFRLMFAQPLQVLVCLAPVVLLRKPVLVFCCPAVPVGGQVLLFLCSNCALLCSNCTAASFKAVSACWNSAGIII